MFSDRKEEPIPLPFENGPHIDDPERAETLAVENNDQDLTTDEDIESIALIEKSETNNIKNKEKKQSMKENVSENDENSSANKEAVHENKNDSVTYESQLL